VPRQPTSSPNCREQPKQWTSATTPGGYHPLSAHSCLDRQGSAKWHRMWAFTLPARLGGLGIVNPASSCSREFYASVSISAPLSHLIKHEVPEYSGATIECQMHAKQEVRKQRQEVLKSSAATLKVTLKDSLKHAMDLAQEKGASTWLTSLLLEDYGFSLHKAAFRDAMALRYGWLSSKFKHPTNCASGSHFTLEHVLSCPKGGFPSIRHNEVCDTVGSWLLHQA